MTADVAAAGARCAGSATAMLLARAGMRGCCSIAPLGPPQRGVRRPASASRT